MTDLRHATPDDPSVTAREPALSIAAVLAVVIAVGGFFSTWGGGVDWRIALGGALVAGAASMGAGAAIRGQVTPEPNVVERVNDAISHTLQNVDTSHYTLPEPIEVAHPGDEPA